MRSFYTNEGRYLQISIRYNRKSKLRQTELPDLIKEYLIYPSTYEFTRPTVNIGLFYHRKCILIKAWQIFSAVGPHFYVTNFSTFGLIRKRNCCANHMPQWLHICRVGKYLGASQWQVTLDTGCALQDL